MKQHIIYFYFILSVIPCIAHAQIITTIAGNGIFGYGGNSGPATLATLNGPSGVALDSNNNLYFTDNANWVVRMINSRGIISTIAGNNTFGYGGDGGPATNAAIWTPTYLKVAKNGDIYIVELEDERIRKVTTSGNISTVAGYGGYGYYGDGGPAIDASFTNIYDIALDSSENIYIADAGDNVIRKITNSTGIINYIAGDGFGAAHGYGFGYGGYSGDGGSATLAELNTPCGVAIDDSGYIYIADTWNSVVRKINPTGIITTIAGNGIAGYSGDGGQASASSLNHPGAIAVDKNGNIYLSDSYYSRIRKINKSGIITTIAGNGSISYGGDNGPATAAGINPTSIAVDLCHNLYIADQSNSRIRKISGISGIVAICQGTSTLLEDDAPGGTWLTSTPSIASIDSTGVVTGISSGSAYIYYIIGADTAVTPVVVNTAPISGVISGNTNLCVRTMDTLTTTSSLGYWHGSNSSASVTGNVITGTTPGIDTVYYTVNYTCGNATSLFVVTVNSTPDAGRIFGTDSLCQGDTILLSESVTGGYWGNKDTLLASLIGAGSIVGESPGNDTVIYTVTNAGCSIETAYPIKIKSTSSCTEGVIAIEKQNTLSEVHPNPAYTELSITSSNTIKSISIINPLGQQVFTNKYNSSDIQISVANLPTGVYFIKINGIEVKRFVKK